MFGIESWPHHQASAIPQSDFNARIIRRARPRRRHLHFQELCCRVFLQPLLPHEEVWPAQAALAAKCFHRLSATRLLGNQLSPLRPCLLRALLHAATLQWGAAFLQDGVRLTLTQAQRAIRTCSTTGGWRRSVLLRRQRSRTARDGCAANLGSEPLHEESRTTTAPVEALLPQRPEVANGSRRSHQRAQATPWTESLSLSGRRLRCSPKFGPPNKV